MEEEWIKFDIDKLTQLQDDYQSTLSIIKASLPEINLNSRKQIVNFFEKSFKIELQSSRIKEISSYLLKFGENSEEYEIITGIILYFKMYYQLKNYITYILNHHEEGMIQLRWYMGKWCLQNRQTLPYSKAIIDCITEISNPDLIVKETTWE